MKKTVYIGMALTNAPKDFVDEFYPELCSALEATGNIEIIKFLGLEAGEPLSVHKYDTGCIASADLMVGICDYPSTGLGMEIMHRHNLKKPLLLFSHKDATITRMVIGFAQNEDLPCIKYKTVDDIVDQVVDHFTQSMIAEAAV